MSWRVYWKFFALRFERSVWMILSEPGKTLPVFSVTCKFTGSARKQVSAYCPEKLWSPFSGSVPTPGWTGLWAACLRKGDPAHGRGVGTMWPLGSFPSQTIPWYSPVTLHKLSQPIFIHKTVQVGETLRVSLRGITMCQTEASLL